MILFGALAYRIRLPDADVPEWEPTWYLPPSSAPTGARPADDLLARLQARSDDQSS
jgi:hypothetical protein